MTEASVRSAIGEEISLAALEEDPYPIYARLRAEEPVSWLTAVKLWFVTRWDDVRGVIDTPQDFTAATIPSTLDRTVGKTLMRTDGHSHKRARSILESAFTQREVRRYLDSIIEKHAGNLIDTFADRGEAELVKAFCEPFSVRVLRDVLGLGGVEEKRLRDWFDRFAAGGANFESDPEKQAYADEGSADADTALAGLIEQLERQPDHTVLSALVNAGDGQLSRAELLANIKLMILGGMQEPRDLVGLILIALLRDPEQLELVREDPARLRAAVDEGMRCFSPVGTLTRQTTRPLAIGDVALPAGAMVAAVIASANRDERRFSDPDRFDLRRSEGIHLAFGAGAHFCLGAALARYETMVALRALIERLRALELDSARPPEVRGWEFRGPVSLHVRWNESRPVSRRH